MIIIKVKDGASFRNLDPSLITPPVWSRIISQYGNFSFSYPITDEKSDLLTDSAEIQIFEKDDVLGLETYIIGGFIAKEPANVLVGTTRMKSIQGNGYMSEFSHDLTVANVVYINVPYTDVLDPAYAKTFIKPNTWVTNVEPTTEDLTYLSSMQRPSELFRLVKRQLNYDYRYSGTAITPRQMDFGLFGQDSGVRLRMNPKSSTELGDDLLVIKDLTQSVNYEDIKNYIVVLGGGW